MLPILSGLNLRAQSVDIMFVSDSIMILCLKIEK